MSNKFYLNNDWLFTETITNDIFNENTDSSGMVSVRIPHTSKETPYNYFDESIYQMVSGYRKDMVFPKEWEGREVLLTFEGVAHESEVYLNGVKVAEHHCGYTAFTVNISSYIIFGSNNILVVKVDSRESNNIPPFGYVVDYMTYGGIYRDVYIEVKEHTYIQDIFVHADIEICNINQDRFASSAIVKDEINKDRFTSSAIVKDEINKDRFTSSVIKKDNIDQDRFTSSATVTDNINESAFAGIDISDDSVSDRTQLASAVLHSEIQICNFTKNCHIAQYIREKGSMQYKLIGNTEITANAGIISYKLENVKLWSTDEPNLYEIRTELIINGQVIDKTETIFGFRNAVFKEDGFYLNGKKVKIRGLNRHQSYPYVGYAMPKSMQIMDANILKYELGLNAVRTSHYPQSHDFINRCDELGLLVFTEIPGWQHIGDDEWKEQAVKNTADMVMQYRNHPSIILWGVRINESKDDDEFYKKTNEVARKLDPTRQTAGVRAHKNSSLLEDVYTYNDFSHNGSTPGCEPKKKVTSDEKKPYMISEYNGHMYPTKAFDCEEHRMEHTIRHANVLDAVSQNEDIAGSFGWCMTDYNTHKDFGSGDRICYHGVMDMFRNPKDAAAIYACQSEENVHLHISSTMDIGEHPECNRGNTWIISNADSIRMYKNDRFIKEYTQKNSPYKNLLHGPILIDDYIGDAILKGEKFTKKQAEDIKYALNSTALHGLAGLPKKVIFIALKMMIFYGMKPTEAVTLYNKYIGDWGGASTVYRFEAIKDGNVVKTVIKEPMRNVEITAQADHVDLTESHTYDVAAVRIQARDDNGNILPFYQEPVQIEAFGPIEIIGPKVISLKGGMGGTYIKTLGFEGNAKIVISSMQSACKEINFRVIIDSEC